MKEFDWKFPYPSQRMPVLASNVVATSQPLAAQAGLTMLLKGGNAVDAALATAITLLVVEPTSCGIGGDAFAIVWDGHKLQGLNASGRSPAAWTPELFKGLKSMPGIGWKSVTVPGQVSGWVMLSERFGSLPFAELFEPAMEYARNGFLVSPKTAIRWSSAPETYKDFPEFADVFLPGGRPLKAGERFSLPELADTLQRIAETKGATLYRGDLAEKIVAHAQATGGFLTLEDLAEHESEWVETISQDYGGLTLHEIPPNGQGLAALLTLGILKHWELKKYPVDSADSLHLQIEAMKLAFADAHRYIADADYMEVEVKDLLSPAYLEPRAKEIDAKKAKKPKFGMPKGSGTVYLTTADEKGMMVSFIQSNFLGFGSGIVIPGICVAMQSRGMGFSLEEGHPNQVGPKKRPYHTIIPGFVMRGKEPVMSFGVMGGPMQPQGHTQMMIRLVDYGQNPQAACDAPRWRVLDGLNVAVEKGFKPEVLDELRNRGHQLQFMQGEALGGAQLIYRLEGGYVGASDHRKDGQALGF